MLTPASLSGLLRRPLPAAALALLILAAAGCGRDDVKVYHVAKDESPAAPPTVPAAESAAMPDTVPVPSAATQPPLTWTLPDGWQAKAPTELRVASFGVTNQAGKQADVSVIPLSGTAGGDTANVNRWRGQVGLAKLADDDLLKTAEKLEIDGQPADLYDIAGTSPGSGDPERIVGTIQHRDETAWFFKMTGDAQLVEEQKPAFIAFLKSVKFVAPVTPANLDLNNLPSSHPPVGAASLPAMPADASAGADKPTWTVPSDWQEVPATQFLLAKYNIGAGDATAAATVSKLAGDGGGLLANVNRWRQQQLGLDRVDDAGLAQVVTTLNATAGQASVVDFTGTSAGKKTRMVGVVLPLGGQTWFYKLTGDPDVVAQQKDAFTKFVQSAKYPDAH